MKVFGRITRGRISAEDVQRRDVMVDHTETEEDEIRQILYETKNIKKNMT